MFLPQVSGPTRFDGGFFLRSQIVMVHMYFNDELFITDTTGKLTVPRNGSVEKGIYVNAILEDFRSRGTAVGVVQRPARVGSDQADADVEIHPWHERAIACRTIGFRYC